MDRTSPEPRGGRPVGRPAGQHPRRPLSRRVRLTRTIVVLVALIGLLLVVVQRRSDPGLGLARAEHPAAAPCVAGPPTRLVMPALGVDAAVEGVGVDRRGAPASAGDPPLGTPVDPRKAGWYAAGPLPGAGVGTVLTDGHAAPDGSALFRETFGATVAVGQQIDLVIDNGSTCSYRITQVWHAVDPVHAYPDLVTSQGLYAQQGPERLFLATGGGPWLSDAHRFQDVEVVLATPVGR